MSIFNFGRKTAKRSNVYVPENARDETQAAAPEGEKKDEFVKLITAMDNSEEAVIESILRSAGIPYVIREASSEGYVRVIMGFNVYGSDFYVPASLLDDAAALLVPEEAEEVEPEDGEEDDAGNDDENGDAEDADEPAAGAEE